MPHIIGRRAGMASVCCCVCPFLDIVSAPPINTRGSMPNAQASRPSITTVPTPRPARPPGRPRRSSIRSLFGRSSRRMTDLEQRPAHQPVHASGAMWPTAHFPREEVNRWLLQQYARHGTALRGSGRTLRDALDHAGDDPREHGLACGDFSILMRSGFRPLRLLLRLKATACAISQFEKASAVAKLGAARKRKREREGRCEGRKPLSETKAEVAPLARKLRRRKPKVCTNRLCVRCRIV